MSVTGHNADVRQDDDTYLTPAWAVHRLLEACALPGGTWLEPCAGNGAIIRACSVLAFQPVWHADEIRPECEASLRDLAHYEIHDFLTQHRPDARYSVAITNPPFSLSLEFLRRCMEVADEVVFLQRLPWLASAKRAGLFRRCTPDVYVLPDRPSFVNIRRRVRETKGKNTGKLKWVTTTTDATDYGWMRFRGERDHGTFQILAPTPEDVRAAQRPPLVVLGDETHAWDEMETAA